MSTASSGLAQLATVQRDHYGRYLIPDPATGKSRAWTRATTVASTLSDKFGLQAWGQRMTARGLVARPDLFALVAACDPDDKKRLDGYVEDAKEAAAANSGRNLGTALHAFSEQLDRGETVTAPHPWDADLAAYQQTMRAAGIGIDAAYVENIVTLHAAGVAGTFDRLVTVGDTLTVADLKTGSFLDWHEISIQLALYAHADTIYNPATGTHTPMPTVDQHSALVMHLPAGQATCTLWTVDIEAGWGAAQEALAVREWRKRKQLAHTFKPVAPTPATDPDPLLERQAAWLRGRVETIVNTLNGAPLPAPWPPTTPTFKQGGPISLAQCDELAVWCSQCEADLGIAFPDQAPHHALFGDATKHLNRTGRVAYADHPAGPVPAALNATDVVRIIGHNSNTNQ